MLQSRKYLYIVLIDLSILVLQLSNLFYDNQFQGLQIESL